MANLAAADANVKRLEELEGFKHVYAPFEGVITRRTVDPGALINAGNAGAAGRELFDIARTDPLRVYVSVPQAYAPAIYVGLDAVITLQEFPGQKFKATVARTADAIDATTRTLLTEVDVPNPDGKLLPGSFGEVHFKPKIDAKKVTVPVNAMLFRKEGAQVAVVGSDGKVELRHITIGRDYGTTLEIVGGVDVNDQIIVNPSDSIEDGQKVNIAAPRGRSEVMKRLTLAAAIAAAACWPDAWWARTISVRAGYRPGSGLPTRPSRRGARPLPKTRFPKARGGKSSTTPS